MTKQQLLELIDGVSATLVYGLALLRTSEHDGGEARMIESVGTSGMGFEGRNGKIIGMGGPEIRASFSVPAHLQAVKGNFVFVLRTALVRFGYESILLYCEENDHEALMKAEPWCDYARVVRNVVSHGNHAELREWPAKWQDTAKNRARGTRKASVSWRDRTLSETDVGGVIDFGLYDAWQLYLDMRDFVLNRLP